MTSDAILINWYVDEPTCLGVTPYISPYIRMVAGVFAERGLTTKYVTIDQLHRDPVPGHQSFFVPLRVDDCGC